MIKNFTIGSDAEVFALSVKDKSVFPVCGLIGGTKKKPKPVAKGYFVQEDNVLLEFNIPPSKGRDEFIKHMHAGYRHAINCLPPSLKPSLQATGHIDKAFLDIPQACEFGCEPDFNAWTRQVNPRPFSEDETLRSAAAHVHLGWDEPTTPDREAVIRAADVFVSIPSIKEDPDRTRRQLYGRAGAFRFKDYGVEHRVLSNYWIGSQEIVGAVYDRYIRAIDFVNKGKAIDEADGEDIQKAINEYNYELGLKLYKKYVGLFNAA